MGEKAREREKKEGREKRKKNKFKKSDLGNKRKKTGHLSITKIWGLRSNKKDTYRYQRNALQSTSL